MECEDAAGSAFPFVRASPVRALNLSEGPARLIVSPGPVETCDPDVGCYAYRLVDGGGCGCGAGGSASDRPLDDFRHGTDTILAAGAEMRVLVANAGALYRVELCPPVE